MKWGIRIVEGERPTKEFEKLQDSCDIRWIIGYKPSLNYTTICIVLESKREILEYVLEQCRNKNE